MTHPQNIVASYEGAAPNGDHSALVIHCGAKHGTQQGAVLGMLHGVAADYVKDLIEENARLREALHPHPGTLDTSPLILYFGNAVDRAQFIELFKEAKPGAQTYEVPPARPTLVK